MVGNEERVGVEETRVDTIGKEVEFVTIVCVLVSSVCGNTVGKR